ncbi:MAG TPA: right-handed parallel beta-helix repeat-containing protein [Solirubrobacterales bacterium]|nr:right-handed parallel beta-helix repeat-containing protein [Solirubrobacterales bacterium]
MTNTADSGAGSLRQALTESNAAGPGNTIAFAIPGPGPHVIAPASDLPSIGKDDTTIDGCTQSGSDCSELPLSLQIQLHGRKLAPALYGITIRGISFTGTGVGIETVRAGRENVFTLPQNLTIEKNYIGLAPDGSANGKTTGISLSVSQRNIPNPYSGLRILDNVISANSALAINGQAGAFAPPTVPQGVRVAGNIIGLDPTGTQPRPNGGDGIAFDVTSDLRILDNTIAENGGVGIVHRGRTQAVPGTPPGPESGLLIRGNVIRNNAGGGVRIEPEVGSFGSAASDPYSGPVRILGNTISANGAAGINLIQTADSIRPNITIGDTLPGEGNLVTGNAGAGVAIGANSSDTSIAVTVRGNSIYANTGLPIDLASDGPTENGEAGVVRSGPNSHVNHPLITAIGHGSVIVDGTYAGPAESAFTLDFYASETADGPEIWIGSTLVTTDAAGIANFHAEFASDVPAGWVIEATATDADGSTSEFGEPMIVPERPPAPPTPASGNPAAAQSPGTQPGQPQPSKKTRQRKRGKPVLVLQMEAGTTSARPGSVVAYEITVRNRGGGPARAVKVCSEPSSELTILRTEPAASGGGSPCWRLERLAAGGKRVFRLTAQIAADAERGVERNVATVSAANVKGVRSDSAGVRVEPLPDNACLASSGFDWFPDARFFC